MATVSSSFNADTNIILDVGEVLHERYRVLQQLGAGRYSAVYLARDQKYAFPTPCKTHRNLSFS